MIQLARHPDMMRRSLRHTYDEFRERYPAADDLEIRATLITSRTNPLTEDDPFGFLDMERDQAAQKARDLARIHDTLHKVVELILRQESNSAQPTPPELRGATARIGSILARDNS